MNVVLKNTDICHIRALKKYFFAVLVSAYVLTVAGVPVYLHYCGGELEEISYLTKGSNCCGDETPVEDNDCCQDEDLLLINSPDFTLKNSAEADFVKTFAQLFYLQLPFEAPTGQSRDNLGVYIKHPDPPRTQNDIIPSITVLRI